MGIDLNKWLIVVPARLQSTRLPKKPLADLCGKALIVRVCERLEPLKALGAKIIVATDSDERLTVHAENTIEARMTKVDHQSGTDRVFEVSEKYDYLSF